MWSSRPAGPLRPVQWLALDPPAPEADDAAAGETAAEARRRAEQEAGRIIDAARREQAALLADAAAQAGAVLENARLEGLRQGRAEGLAAAEAECAEQLRQARREVHLARAQRRALLRALEGEIAAAVMDIARRVLDRELEQSPDEVVGLARRLLRRVHGPARAHVHPGFAPVLEAEAAVAGLPLTVQPDPSVGSGGLILETEDGLLDATVGGRLRRAESALREGGGHDA